MIAAAFSFCVLVAPLAQFDDGSYAKIGDAVVSHAEFAHFVASEHRASEFASNALDDLISERIVFVEAERRGLSVTAEQVEARFATFEREFEKSARDAGAKDLRAYLDSMEIDLDVFKRKLKPVLLLEQLVRAEFDLDDDEPVPQEKLNVWIQDRVARAQVDKQSVELSPDLAARIDGVPIGIDELGERLLEAAGSKKVNEWLDELIGCHIVEQAAQKHGLALSEPDVDAGLDVWEKEFRERQKDPTADLRRMLAEKGLTLESLRGSRLFRAKLLMEKLVDKFYPDPELRAFFDAHRDEFMERSGRSVKMRIVFLKAGAPGAVDARFVPRGYEAATQQLNAQAALITTGAVKFEEVAKSLSEHASAAQGGAVGQLVASSRTPLGKVATRALALSGEKPGLVAPIEATEGVYLVELLDVQAPPGYDQLKTVVRVRAREELFKTLKDGAGVERRAL